MKPQHPLLNVPSSDLQEAILRFDFMYQVIEHFGYKTTAVTRKIIKERIISDKLQPGKLLLSVSERNKTAFKSYRKPATLYLKKDTIVNSHDLKIKIIRDGILKHECSICTLPPLWCDKPLMMQLHHINGDNTDNRIENIQLLCPNCHAQTATYGGKNHKIRKFNTGKEQEKKIDISKSEMEDLLKQKTVKEIAVIFNVTPRAVYTRLRRWEIDTGSLSQIRINLLTKSSKMDMI